MVEYAVCLRNPFVVVAGLLGDAAKERFDAARVRDGDSSRVQEMDRRADLREGRIGAEAEAPGEYLERDAASHMREFRAVEIEAHGHFRPGNRRNGSCAATFLFDE